MKQLPCRSWRRRRRASTPSWPAPTAAALQHLEQMGAAPTRHSCGAARAAAKTHLLHAMAHQRQRAPASASAGSTRRRGCRGRCEPGCSVLLLDDCDALRRRAAAQRRSRCSIEAQTHGVPIVGGGRVPPVGPERARRPAHAPGLGPRYSPPQPPGRPGARSAAPRVRSPRHLSRPTEVMDYLADALCPRPVAPDGAARPARRLRAGRAPRQSPCRC